MHSTLTSLIDKHFPLITRKIKSTDLPWITDYIRSLDKLRRREYAKNGRSPRFKCFDKDIKEEIKKEKGIFFDRECIKLTTPGAQRMSFTALKHLNKPGKPTPWNISDLYTDKSKEEIVEILADFYNKISSEFSDLNPSDLITTFDRPITDISRERIAAKIREARKTKSVVPGDIPPSLLNELSTCLSEPLYYIFNAMPDNGWPDQWKTEYQTIIPKRNSPADPNDCRNLACTNFFSKILEVFVLEGLQSEVKLSSKQFGGIKRCGVNHFLLNMWDKILRGLEQDHSSATLMSVDFSKAFNRMSHQACIKAIARKGN